MRPKVVNLKVSRVLRKRSELPRATSSEAEKEWTGLKIFGLDVAVDPGLPPDMLVFVGSTVTGRVAHRVPGFLAGPQDTPITMQMLENRRQRLRQLSQYWAVPSEALRPRLREVYGSDHPTQRALDLIADDFCDFLDLAALQHAQNAPNASGDAASLTPDVARDPRQREAPHARFIAENNRSSRRRR